MNTGILRVVDINLTRDASAHLRVTEAVELRDQDRLCLWRKVNTTIGPKSEVSQTPYFNKVGRVSIIIDAACVEARPSTLCRQAGD